MTRIGIIQGYTGENLSENYTKTLDSIREAAKSGAQIICTQELFKHQYFCQTETHENFKLSEQVPGPGTESLRELAGELGVVIIASLFEQRAKGIYHNTLAVFDADGEYLGKYRKIHVPDDPGYYEKFYFTPGDLGYQVFNTKFGKIGTLVCWDQWFPEAARLTAMKGADIIFYPTAIGWDVNQDQVTNTQELEAWRTIQRSHAIANGVHVVAVNRVGTESNIKFWGSSLVVNPFGKVLFEADDKPCIEVVDVDFEQTTHYRTYWPFFRDRRIDSYGAITQQFTDDSD